MLPLKSRRRKNLVPDMAIIKARPPDWDYHHLGRKPKLEHLA
jgi:hypothetical protein